MNMVKSWPEHLARSSNELLGSCVTAGERWEVDQRSSPWRQESDFRSNCQASKYGGGTHVLCGRPSSLSREGKYSDQFC